MKMAEKDSPDDDRYWTIRDRARSSLTVRGSRFIGIAAPVETEAAADVFIGEIVKTYHDATHHCTAYRVGKGSRVTERTHDDGEPPGTAGRPILEAILNRDLRNVVCVVTRYFGGVKLGTGGLFRAYRECASDTLDRARIEVRYEQCIFKLRYAYKHTGIVMQLIDRFEGEVRTSAYDDARPMMRVALRRSRADAFTRAIVEGTSGSAEILREEVRAN